MRKTREAGEQKGVPVTFCNSNWQTQRLERDDCLKILSKKDKQVNNLQVKVKI